MLIAALDTANNPTGLGNQAMSRCVTRTFTSSRVENSRQIRSATVIDRCRPQATDRDRGLLPPRHGPGSGTRAGQQPAVELAGHGAGFNVVGLPGRDRSAASDRPRSGVRQKKRTSRVMSASRGGPFLKPKVSRLTTISELDPVSIRSSEIRDAGSRPIRRSVDHHIGPGPEQGQDLLSRSIPSVIRPSGAEDGGGGFPCTGR